MSLEGWCFFDALWFTFETYTTIGFGEYHPRTPGGRAFYIGWGVTGIIILTILFSLVSEAWALRFSDGLRKRVVRRHIKVSGYSKDQESGPMPCEIMRPSPLPPPMSPQERNQQHQQQQQTQDTQEKCEDSGVGMPNVENEEKAQQVSEEIIECHINEEEQEQEGQVVDGDEPTEVKLFTQDLRIFLDECERFIGHLVKNDTEAMRESLSRILVEQDGMEDDLAWIMVTQDNDGMVGKMVLKHAQNRFVDIRRRLNAMES